MGVSQGLTNTAFVNIFGEHDSNVYFNPATLTGRHCSVCLIDGKITNTERSTAALLKDSQSGAKTTTCCKESHLNCLQRCCYTFWVICSHWRSMTTTGVPLLADLLITVNKLAIT